MQSTHERGNAWTYVLDLTDHPSPRRVVRFFLRGTAVASLYVGVLATLGVFGGAVWWFALGVAALGIQGVVK